MRLLYVILLTLASTFGFSQSDSTAVKSDSISYRIVKFDGGEFVGKIITEDAREILFLTNSGRKIIIPQHVIKTIERIDQTKFNEKGEYIGLDRFSTRYFITTNGLPIKKGDHYIQWNLFGPDLEFGIGKNFGLGLMTTWVGIPIIGTIKKSWKIGNKTNLAIGGLLGTGSWALPNYAGILPYTSFSYGDRSANFTISGGYGGLILDGNPEGRALTSLAGMIKVSPKFSLVFDSFILLPGPLETRYEVYYETIYNENTMQYEDIQTTKEVEYRNPWGALIIPGVRWHKEEGKAFQFGFAGIIDRGEVIPVPFPMIQWFRTI